MNWEAINAVAQLISSIGVVASLWYLAIQVHRSTRITRLAAQDAASTALRDVTRPFAENAESGRIWRIGLENLEALSPDDKARFFHFAFQFLKAMETIHFHYIYGLEFYWQTRHYLFSERFQEFVAGLDRPAQRLTVANLLGQEKVDK